MRSSSFLRQGALQAHVDNRFWRSDHDFLIASNSSVYLGWIVSKITRLYCRPDMTSSSFLLQGTLYAILHDGFWKSDHDFLIAFHSNFLCGMHGFRDNEVLLQAEYDVLVIPPPRVDLRYFTWQILKERPRLYIHVQLTLFVYLERFRSYSTFFIWLGFPYCGRTFYSMFYLKCKIVRTCYFFHNLRTINL